MADERLPGRREKKLEKKKGSRLKKKRKEPKNANDVKASCLQEKNDYERPSS